MGVIDGLLKAVFGTGTSSVRDTIEIFRENTEAGAKRDSEKARAALEQFASEFGGPRKGWFDHLIDGLNRVPRPAMALGTIGLFVAAMVDPIWFAARMEGVALVPEPLWWLLGAIVSFYFGARYQSKGQEFQRSLARTLAVAPIVQSAAKPPHKSKDGASAKKDAKNQALRDWRDSRAD